MRGRSRNIRNRTAIAVNRDFFIDTTSLIIRIIPSTEGDNRIIPCILHNANNKWVDFADVGEKEAYRHMPCAGGVLLYMDVCK